MPIYLDYNATTPIDPAVRDAMLPWLGEGFGNPSSSHESGRKARSAVDHAREQVAELLGCTAGEVVFTGGGTEASNHAIKGIAFARLRGFLGRFVRGMHVITTAVEHPATLQPCEFLRRTGATVSILPVDGHGLVDPADVRRAITRGTVLISVMHANNEVGTIMPIREIAAIGRERGIAVHCDAAQSVGKIPVRVGELGVDLLSVAGHKLYAPKGAGALYVREGTRLEPLLHGAGHENARRAGTENVPYIVGLGKACEVAARRLPEAGQKLQSLRDRLWGRLRQALGDRIHLNGHPELRLPNTLHVSFLGRTGAELLAAVPEVEASVGSACHAGVVHASPVLNAMRVSADVLRGAVRLSVGRFTTEEEIDRAAAALLGRLSS